MGKTTLLTVNSAIKNILSTNKIPLHDGLSVLLCLYYGVEPSYIPLELERKVLATGIVSKDYSDGTIDWRFSLFEETETGFEWISDWMDLFKNANPDRRGTKSFVLTRMKKFFANNPSVRKEEIFSATNAYLKTLGNPLYCKKSHKFIYEQDGSSMLLDYIENEKYKSKLFRRIDEDII